MPGALCTLEQPVAVLPFNKGQTKDLGKRIPWLAPFADKPIELLCQKSLAAEGSQEFTSCKTAARMGHDPYIPAKVAMCNVTASSISKRLRL